MINSNDNAGLPITIRLPGDFLEDETRCDFHVDKKRKRIWAIELDLLEQLLCSECSKWRMLTSSEMLVTTQQDMP